MTIARQIVNDTVTIATWIGCLVLAAGFCHLAGRSWARRNARHEERRTSPRRPYLVARDGQILGEPSDARPVALRRARGA